MTRATHNEDRWGRLTLISPARESCRRDNLATLLIYTDQRNCIHHPRRDPTLNQGESTMRSSQRTPFFIVLIIACGIAVATHSITLPTDSHDVQAQMSIPTATPHMTCLVENSVSARQYLVSGVLVNGPQQGNVIRIPSLHPACQDKASSVNPMHALVNNKAHLNMWDNNGNLIYDGDAGLHLGFQLLTGPDCTSQDGYIILAPFFGRYEARVSYQCCFSCYQTATPPPTTATPPTP